MSLDNQSSTHHSYVFPHHGSTYPEESDPSPHDPLTRPDSRAESDESRMARFGDTLDQSRNRGIPLHYPRVSHMGAPHPVPGGTPVINNSVNSILTMPNPGSKLAPEKFRGDFHKVADFLAHFERLCAQHNVTDDEEKCKAVLRYCSRKERQTIKNMESFIAGNWAQLHSAILNLYDADLDTKRYRVKDIKRFVSKRRTK